MNAYSCPECHQPIVPNMRLCPICGAVLSTKKVPKKTITESKTASPTSTINQSKAAISRQTSQSRQRPKRPSRSSKPTLEGHIIQISTARPEPPNRDIWRILFGILLILDLAILSLSLLYTFITLIIIVFVLSLFMGRTRGWLLSTITFFMRPIWSSIRSLFQRGLTSLGRDAPLIPVTIYRVALMSAKGGGAFRVKGNFSNATLEIGDYVRVWGTPNSQGVIQFRHGEYIKPGSQQTHPLRQPTSWSWVWFMGLMLLNLFIFFNGASL